MNHSPHSRRFYPGARLFLIVGLFVSLSGCRQPSPTPAPQPTDTPLPTAATPPTAAAILPTPIPIPRPVTSGQIAPKIGVDLGGVGDRALEFVDVARTLRRWERIEADSCGEDDDACRYAPLNENGWPTSDTRAVFFDFRPFGAWWSADQAQCPLCQDGNYQIDVSGTYRLSFTGRAALIAVESTTRFENQHYDEATNTTTADVIVPEGKALLFVGFTDTRRAPDAEPNSGIGNVRLIRPGFDPNTDETFTPWILEAVRPFDTLRFMNWVGGNNVDPGYEADDNTLDWSERNLPQMRQNQGEGVAWEVVIELANLSGKNIWINVPIHASDDYVLGLANLLSKQLDPRTTIYIESSNEVWNPLFSQHHYNAMAAEAEVAAGDSPLDNDGSTLPGQWAQRRHVKRLVEISNLFRAVFGNEAINSRIRVIHSWWSIEPGAYRSQLQWAEKTYGPPNQYFYAVAAAGYFNIEGIDNSASLDDVLSRLERSSRDQARGYRAQLQQVADEFGLQHAMYEGGPDTAGPLQWDRDTQLLLNTIDAHRDPKMKDLILYDLWNNWYAHPQVQGDMFIYFTLQSAYSRWGMWGLTEDITDLHTPKFQAITDLVGITHSVPPAPPGLIAKALPDGTVYLAWEASFGAQSYTVRRGENESGPFTAIGTGLTDTVFIDADASSHETSYYLVTAANEQGKSGESRAVGVTSE
ncbi:MAG: hypothetical protein JXA89_04850 [Anaerolineae bacterium]|nr:hypothetical protein [Anaerolineae bacterium]